MLTKVNVHPLIQGIPRREDEKSPDECEITIGPGRANKRASRAAPQEKSASQSSASTFSETPSANGANAFLDEWLGRDDSRCEVSLAMSSPGGDAKRGVCGNMQSQGAATRGR
jgi:hypothetical protein